MRPVARKLLLTATALLGVLLASGWWGPHMRTASTTGKQTGERVRFAPVERGNISRSIRVTGTLQPVAEIEVGTELSGRVIEIDTDFNEPIRLGQVLARLDPSMYEVTVREHEAAVEVARSTVLIRDAAVARARARHEGAVLQAAVFGALSSSERARYERSRRDFRRETSLADDGSISRRQLDDSETDYRSATSSLKAAEFTEQTQQSEIEVAEASLRMAAAELINAEASLQQQLNVLERSQLELASTSIRSPIDGVVIDRHVESGQTLNADDALVLFSVARDLHDMVLHAVVDEADIGSIRVGQHVAFGVDAFPQVTFEGQVTQVRKAPDHDYSVVTYIVVISADNSDLLLFPGMTATASIIVESVENVLMIPRSALYFHPDGPAFSDPGSVWVATDDGAAEAVPIAIGLSDSFVAEVRGDGIEVGRRVATGMLGD